MPDSHQPFHEGRPKSSGQRSQYHETSDAGTHNHSSDYNSGGALVGPQRQPVTPATRTPRSKTPKSKARVNQRPPAASNARTNSQTMPSFSPDHADPSQDPRALSGVGSGTSPNPQITESSLPDRPSHSATPSKQVYAGPLFHASPAASSLPLPRQFSRSVPAVSQETSLQAKFERESGSGNMEHTKSNADTPLEAPSGTEESPLNFFFRAQKAEKANIPFHTSTPQPRPKSAVVDENRHFSAPVPRHVQGGPQRQGKASGSARPSGKEMFMMEMDGVTEHSDSEGPNNSIPFKKRLEALHQDSESRKSDPEEEERQQKTQALKALLLKPSKSHPSARSEVPGLAPRSQPSDADGVHQQAGFQSRGEKHSENNTAWVRTASPSAMLPNGTEPPGIDAADKTDVQYAENLRNMEDSLRRVLKMDGTKDI